MVLHKFCNYPNGKPEARANTQRHPTVAAMNGIAQAKARDSFCDA